MTSQVTIRPMYSIKSFCEEFDMRHTKTYDEIKKGRLRTIKVGKLTRISGEDALAWLNSHRDAHKAA